MRILYSHFMLAVLRLPVIDFRPFAANEEVRESVRLPITWSEGDFVRGIGSVRRRPAGVPEGWPAERSFADLSQIIKFQPRAVQNLNETFLDYRVHSLKRRLWSGLPGVDALFDCDFVVPFSQVNRLWTYQSLKHLAQIPMAVCRLPVFVRNLESPNQEVPLSLAGSEFISHFQRHTSCRPWRNDRYVRSASAVIGVETPGMRPRLDLGVPRTDRYEIGQYEILSFRLPTGGHSSTQCYWISSDQDTKESRRAVRALRIHLMRLHSISEFMALLLNNVWGRTSQNSLFVQQPSPAYDKLQLAITMIIRDLRQERITDVGDTGALLSVALTAHNVLQDSALEVLKTRLLAAARPAVLGSLTALQQEEDERSRIDAVLKYSRDRSGVLNIFQKGAIVNDKIFDFRGANVGAAGDNPVASNFIQQSSSSALTLGSDMVDRFKLVAELAELRNVLARAAKGGEETADAQRALLEAETSAREGDGDKVKAALSKTGNWVLKLAESTGSAVAAAAIKASLGL